MSHMLITAAIISLSSGLGYFLPAIIGLESLGLPSPGETALVLAATLASEHKLQIWLVIVIAAASAILGDNIGYLLGRHFGRRVFEAPGPFQKRRIQVISAGDRFFKKHGGKAVFLGRWIALVRFATAWLAGINEMNFFEFFSWNAAGGILWAIAYGLAGYYGGHALITVFKDVGIGAGIAVGVAIVVVLVVLKIREHRAGASEPPAGGAEEPS